MLLVTRREGRSIRRYAHLSTGNYNPRTAKLYTDLSHITCDPKLTQDVESVFNLLANQSKIPRLNKLMIAPFQLQRSLIDKVEKTAEAAKQGVASRIILKMNTLTDEKLMEALVHAGQHGVQIDLIIRGACMLPAQRPGLTDNIRVRSIIGRFLEHSRVFYFRTGAEESLYLSSADWMNRNMLRRVELAWPVEDSVLRQRVIDECLVAYLHDNVDAWSLDANGHYSRVQPAKPKRSSAKTTSASTPAPMHGAQAALMALHGSKP
jgi:polyphosphate kinase